MPARTAVGGAAKAAMNALGLRRGDAGNTQRENRPDTAKSPRRVQRTNSFFAKSLTSQTATLAGKPINLKVWFRVLFFPCC